MPKTSAIYGLPDDREVVVEIKADHSNICRFDMTDARDQGNFKRVWNALEDMYELAIRQGELERISTGNSEADQRLRNLPSAPQEEPNYLSQ